MNLYNKYDLIFDGGSTDHIFNVLKALENYWTILDRVTMVGLLNRIVQTKPQKLI